MVSSCQVWERVDVCWCVCDVVEREVVVLW